MPGTALWTRHTCRGGIPVWLSRRSDDSSSWTGFCSRCRSERSSLRGARWEHRSYEIVDEIQTLTEAFYYFAFRTMRMFQELPEAPGLPAMKGFDAPGVRNVRNWLVEHPENPSRGFH